MAIRVNTLNTGKWFDHVKNETVPQLLNYIYVKRGTLPQHSNQIRSDTQYLFALATESSGGLLILTES